MRKLDLILTLLILLVALAATANSQVCTSEWQNISNYTLKATSTQGRCAGGVTECALDLSLNFNSSRDLFMWIDDQGTVGKHMHLWRRAGDTWNYEDSFNTPSTSGDTTQCMDIEFNATGSNRSELFLWTTINGVTTFAWDGANWSRNSSRDNVLIGDTGANCAFNVKRDFNGRPAMITKNDTGRWQGFTWTGNNWTANSTVVNGLMNGSPLNTLRILENGSGTGKFVLITNLGRPGNNTWNYEGNTWIENSTISKPETGIVGAFDVIKGFNRTGNVTFFIANSTDGSNAYYVGISGWGDYSALGTASNVLVNVSPFLGDSIAINATVTTNCNNANISALINISNTLNATNSTRVTTRQAGARYVFGINLNASCSYTPTINITFTSNSGQLFRANGIRINVLPAVHNQTGARARASISACTSGTNITLSWNQSVSGLEDVMVNMSKRFFGTNATCFYKANRVEKIRSANRTANCEVLLVNANSTNDITIEFDDQFNPNRPGNLGIGIAVGTIGALTVAYVIARRRRAESS